MHYDVAVMNYPLFCRENRTECIGAVAETSVPYRTRAVHGRFPCIYTFPSATVYVISAYMTGSLRCGNRRR